MAKEKKGGQIATIEEFDAFFGKRRIDAKEVMKVSGYWPTGSLKLDKALGGGFPMGKLVEIYGPPTGGKTTLALATVALALKAGKKCAFYNLEAGLDLQNEGEESVEEDEAERIRKRDSWLRTNGVDPDHPNLRIIEGISGEDLFRGLRATARHGLIDITVVDSIPAIMPERVLEGEPGEATYGLRAKLLSEELPVVYTLFGYGGNRTSTIIFINQVRENIGAQVKSQKAAGGYALDHYMRTKLKIQRIARNERADDVITTSIVKLEKNITGRYSQLEIQISANRGVDLLAELLEFAIEQGYVHTSGNWHYLFDQPVDLTTFKEAQAKKKIPELPGYLTGQNGEGSALKWMGENGWKEKLYPLALAAD